jgi:hypothetical protein
VSDSNENREAILRLLRARPGVDIDFEEFCRRYEVAFNFGIRGTDLNPEEERVLSDLFDTVVWYSPSEKERRELPSHFNGEAEISAALDKARRLLGFVSS